MREKFNILVEPYQPQLYISSLLLQDKFTFILKLTLTFSSTCTLYNYWIISSTKTSIKYIIKIFTEYENDILNTNEGKSINMKDRSLDK